MSLSKRSISNLDFKFKEQSFKKPKLNLNYKNLKSINQQENNDFGSDEIYKEKNLREELKKKSESIIDEMISNKKKSLNNINEHEIKIECQYIEHMFLKECYSKTIKHKLNDINVIQIPTQENLKKMFFKQSKYNHNCILNNCGQYFLEPNIEINYNTPQSLNDKKKIFKSRGNIYLCINTGLIHICSSISCKYSLENDKNESIICPISGIALSSIFAVPYENCNNSTNGFNSSTGEKFSREVMNYKLDSNLFINKMDQYNQLEMQINFPEHTSKESNSFEINNNDNIIQIIDEQKLENPLYFIYNDNNPLLSSFSEEQKIRGRKPNNNKKNVSNKLKIVRNPSLYLRTSLHNFKNPNFMNTHNICYPDDKLKLQLKDALEFIKNIIDSYLYPIDIENLSKLKYENAHKKFINILHSDYKKSKTTIDISKFAGIYINNTQKEFDEYFRIKIKNISPKNNQLIEYLSVCILNLWNLLCKTYHVYYNQTKRIKFDNAIAPFLYFLKDGYSLKICLTSMDKKSFKEYNKSTCNENDCFKHYNIIFIPKHEILTDSNSDWLINEKDFDNLSFSKKKNITSGSNLYLKKEIHKCYRSVLKYAEMTENYENLLPYCLSKYMNLDKKYCSNLNFIEEINIEF